MSREVRRVPLDWKHPVVENPYWREHQHAFSGRLRPPSRLHGPTERFRGLMAPSIGEAIAEWEAGKAAWEAGTSEEFDFQLRYHSKDGWLNDDGTRDEPIPYRVYGDDDEGVVDEFFPESAAELAARVPWEKHHWARPDPDEHMPDFDVPADQLGWCLYETVSEGTPTTPVFATADELIDWLATKGQDYDQEPMRRSAAEAVVRNGGTFGSMVQIGGELLQSDTDADRIEELTRSDN